jgi:Tfp pilus assembly protein PilF
MTQDPFKKLFEKTSLSSLILLIILVAFGAYFNTLFNDFVFDDVENVLLNRWIKDIRYIPEIFSTHVAGFDRGFATSYYRPMMHLMYMFTYFISGLTPWAFHLVNIVFHAGVSILVFLISLRLLASAKPSTSIPNLFPPLLAALLFATHPIHTESVAWVSGITDLSFTFFYLSSLCLYLRAADCKKPFTGNALVSAALFFFATLCKETALTLPIILVIYDYTLKKDLSFSFNHLKKYLPFLIVGAIYFTFRMYALGGFAPSKRYFALTNYQFVINVFPLLLQYLQKLLFPFNLSPIHVFHPITSISQSTGILSVFIILTIMYLASKILSKKIYLFSLCLIVIPLLPALYIPTLGERVFAERYLYLPSFGFVLLLAQLFTEEMASVPQRIFARSVILFIVIGLFFMGTAYRNTIWKDSHTLWLDATKKSPDSAAAHEYLGYALYSRGWLDQAIGQYRIVLSLDVRRSDTHLNLGVAYALKGWTDKAIEEYKTALTLRPNFAEAHSNLGLAFINKGLLDQAIEECQTALTLNPYLADAHHNLGIAYVIQGRVDEAIKAFNMAVTLNPDNQNYRDNLAKAWALKKAGH